MIKMGWSHAGGKRCRVGGKEPHRQCQVTEDRGADAGSGVHAGTRKRPNQHLRRRNLDAVCLSLHAERQKGNAILILQNLHLDLATAQRIMNILTVRSQGKHLKSLSLSFFAQVQSEVVHVQMSE